MGSLRVGPDLSDFTFTFHFHALEKEMATHSSVLAWRIPGTVEPGGLPSVGSHRVGHDWSDLAVAVKCNYLNFNFLKEIKETFSSLVTLADFTCTTATVVIVQYWTVQNEHRCHHRKLCWISLIQMLSTEGKVPSFTEKHLISTYVIVIFTLGLPKHNLGRCIIVKFFGWHWF